MWLWILAGCGAKPLPASSLYEQPSVVTYTEHQRFGDLPERTVAVQEATAVAPGVAAPQGWEGVVYETIRAVDGREEGPRTRAVAADHGVARFASARRGEWRGDDVPKVELPAKVKPGASWSAEHGEGGDRHQRRCQAEPTPFCDAGVAVACTTEWAARSVWMRQHYCADVGWVGFEAVAVADGQPPSVFWSTDAAKDGQALPAAGMEQRPVPAPEELRPPT
jgi:hypothetical protein